MEQIVLKEKRLVVFTNRVSEILEANHSIKIIYLIDLKQSREWNIIKAMKKENRAERKNIHELITWTEMICVDDV